MQFWWIKTFNEAFFPLFHEQPFSSFALGTNGNSIAGVPVPLFWCRISQNIDVSALRLSKTVLVKLWFDFALRSDERNFRVSESVHPPELIFSPFTYCFISSILLFSWIQFSSWKLARHKLSLCYMSQVIIFCSRAGRYVKTAQKHIVMKIANMNDDIKGFANKEPKQSRHKIKTVSANIFYSRYKKYLTAMK